MRCPNCMMEINPEILPIESETFILYVSFCPNCGTVIGREQKDKQDDENKNDKNSNQEKNK